MKTVATLAQPAMPNVASFDRAELRQILDPLAAEDDRSDGAPMDALKHLVACGASHAVLPASMGGAELGWSPRSSRALGDLLRALGGAHLSLARLYEGHVNAFQLIWTYGNSAQRNSVCRYVSAGGWLGVWNAPHPDGPLELVDAPGGGYTLSGMKAYASGAGLINRPLVTAQHASLGYVMVWPRAMHLPGSRDAWEMHGMRASVTLPVRFQHAAVAPDEIVGGDNDYHREPLFTTGAWRCLAAQIGAGERLLEQMTHALVATRRDDDAHQRARLAQASMAMESSMLWLERARTASDAAAAGDEAAHLVRMARLAVERNLLDVIERVQCSVGLAAFRRSALIERIARDLHTYLRQPVPDLVRDRVAAHVIAQARTQGDIA